MHTTRPVAGSSRLPMEGERRDPWKQWALAVVTFGVYGAVHHYRINRELRDFGVDVDPVKALLAFVPGGLVVVPLFVTVYRTAQRIAVAQETTGLAPTIRPGISVIASIFAFLHIAYQQTELNQAWRADTSGEPQ